LVQLEEEFDLTVDWRGFELHPDTPRGGIELSRLHPGSDRADMAGYIQKFAERFGVTGMVRTKRVPNTRRALTVAEYARDQGRLDAFRSATMDAHFKEGRDIENDAVLRDLAVASGLDPDRALGAADTAPYLSRIEAIRAEFKSLNVGGIPTFVFGSEAIEGCRVYEELEAAAVRSGARRRRLAGA
jgi:predicted DsbA family dithiol-disulfide isomerase